MLLADQAVVLTLMMGISVDFSRGTGCWVAPIRVSGLRRGRPLVIGALYAAAMVVRYIIRMARRPDQRWLGGTIPIIFHTIVAAFQWTFGMYHVTMP